MPKRKPDEQKRDRSVDEMVEANHRLQERGRKLLEQLAALTADIAKERAKSQELRPKRKK